jgi:hypothetical protein
LPSLRDGTFWKTASAPENSRKNTIIVVGAESVGWRRRTSTENEQALRRKS